MKALSVSEIDVASRTDRWIAAKKAAHTIADSLLRWFVEASDEAQARCGQYVGIVRIETANYRLSLDRIGERALEIAPKGVCRWFGLRVTEDGVRPGLNDRWYESLTFIEGFVREAATLTEQSVREAVDNAL